VVSNKLGLLSLFFAAGFMGQVFLIYDAICCLLFASFGKLLHFKCTINLVFHKFLFFVEVILVTVLFSMWTSCILVVLNPIRTGDDIQSHSRVKSFLMILPHFVTHKTFCPHSRVTHMHWSMVIPCMLNLATAITKFFNIQFLSIELLAWFTLSHYCYQFHCVHEFKKQKKRQGDR
jgi:hypothetical protein